MDKIRFYSRCASVSDVALRVIKESSYDLFVEGLPNGGMRMRKLYAFIDKLKDAEYARSVESFYLIWTNRTIIERTNHREKRTQ